MPVSAVSGTATRRAPAGRAAGRRTPDRGTAARPAGAGPRAVDPLLVVAHGSRDPRAAASTEALVRRLAAARAGLPVAAGYLEHAGPRPGTVLAGWAALGARRVVVAPLLLTHAYHAGVDLPAVLAEVGERLPHLRIDTVPVPGGDPALLDALDDRAAAAGIRLPGGNSGAATVDGVLLGAAGTRDERARRSVERVAARYARRHSIACVATYAAGGGRDVRTAVGALRAAGARRIALLSYFLAPGLLHDRVVTAAARVGVTAVTDPFGATGSLAGLLLDRYDSSVPRRRPASPVHRS